MNTVGKARLIKIVRLILALVLASQAVSVAAASGAHPLSTAYYVDGTNGSDNNPGTFGQPWKTIQKAANTMIGGDTVYIRAGTYNEQVIPAMSGAAGKWIVYTAYADEVVTIDGTGLTFNSPRDGLFWIAQRSYIRVSGLRVINAMGGQDIEGIRVDYSNNIIVEDCYTYNTQACGIGVWGSDHVVVSRNEVELASHGGSEENISVDTSTNVQISNNEVHHGFLSDYGGEGINIKNGSAYVKVFGNHVHDNPKLAFGLDAWTRYTHDVEFYDNVAHDCDFGFIVESEAGGLAENIRVHNNIAYDNRKVGYYIPIWGNPGPLRNIYFVNNTAYGNGLYGAFVNSTNVDNIVFRNNLFSQNSPKQMEVTAGALAKCVVDHNLFNGLGDPIGDDCVIGDPLFVNPAGGDFHLQGSSPAIDAGSPTGAPNVDFYGNPRPWGAGYDIGASEYTLGAPYEWPYSIYLPFVTRGHRSP